MAAKTQSVSSCHKTFCQCKWIEVKLWCVWHWFNLHFWGDSMPLTHTHTQTFHVYEYYRSLLVMFYKSELNSMVFAKSKFCIPKTSLLKINIPNATKLADCNAIIADSSHACQSNHSFDNKNNRKKEYWNAHGLSRVECVRLCEKRD